MPRAATSASKARAALPAIAASNAPQGLQASPVAQLIAQHLGRELLARMNRPAVLPPTTAEVLP